MLDERAQLGGDSLGKGDHVAASYQQVLRERRGQLGGYSDDLAVGTALLVAGPADVAVVAVLPRWRCRRELLWFAKDVCRALWPGSRAEITASVMTRFSWSRVTLGPPPS